MLAADIFTKRRQNAIQSVKGVPMCVAAFEAVQQTNDAAAPFIQESHFFWLTGITEPGWQLVIEKDKSTLIAPGKSDIQRTFDGGLSVEEAREVSGVDLVIEGAAYNDLLSELSNEYSKIYTIFKHPHAQYFDFVLNLSTQSLKKKLTNHFQDVQDCRVQLARLKAIKTNEEVELIRKAIDVSIKGFEVLKAKLSSYTYEYQAEAELNYTFRYEGSDGHAYQPIVAMGKNACTLHYIANNHTLPKNGLLLIDAGARVGGYAADITRTYAIGTPSQREKDVHAEVEKAHHAIITLIKPGLSFDRYHAAVDVIMRQALNNLGLLKNIDDYRTYFPHAISHGLGIDVHDSLGGFDEFQAGMVLTVEPGIYIPEEGIGVRIEDDILVTAGGHENLSADLPTSL